MRSLVISIFLMLAAGFAAQAAEARIATCLPPAGGLTCHLWTGEVTFMGDGDTVYVDIAGDGRRSSVPVRLTGINATEQTVYSNVPSRRRGECHSLEATARLEQLLRRNRWKVRLYALDPASHAGRRVRRVLATKIGGRWRDVGQLLVREGHAVWLPNAREYAWNVDYARKAEFAASLQRGIWSPTYCGAGPNDESPLRLIVNGDSRFVSDEFVRIRNLDPVNTVPLGGWYVRDSELKRYVFPEWATLPPGESVTVWVGEGTDTWTEFFWGRRNQVFGNLGDNGNGDAAYLVDPQGDVRAWMTYPCARDCTDPNAGAIKVTARPKGREYIVLTNVAAFAVDLEGYRLESKPFSYPFPRDSVIQPGERMRVWVTGDPAEDTRLQKNWGETGSILRDAGDTVRLSSLRGLVIDCLAYGDASC